MTDRDERDTKQLMIGFSFDQIHLLYAKFSIKNAKGDTSTEFVKHAVKDFTLCSDLALSLIRLEKSWVNQAHLNLLVSSIIENSPASSLQLNIFYEKVVAALGK